MSASSLGRMPARAAEVAPRAARSVPPRSGRPLTRERLVLDELVQRLASEDAIALPMLARGFREELLAAARSAPFRPARRVVGHGRRRVLQRMEVNDRFPADSPFHRLVSAFQALWNEALESAAQSPFEGRLELNDLMLQRYQVGELGITAHRDRTAYRNLVCLFVLAGRGAFHVCRDRGGTGSREIPHRPGDVLIMRAPGFLGSDYRPFHLLRDIREPRYVFGLRQQRG